MYMYSTYIDIANKAVVRITKIQDFIETNQSINQSYICIILQCHVQVRMIGTYRKHD